MARQIIRWERWYELSVLKSGKPGRRLVDQSAAYCEINACDLCGRMGGLKDVRERQDCYRWNMMSTEEYPKPGQFMCMLCTSCWAKVQIIDRLRRASMEIQALANRLKREAYEQKHRRNAGGANGRDR